MSLTATAKGVSMDLRIFTEPQQGATYDDLVRVAQETERLGFSAFFRSDHYLHMGSVSGLPGPTDAWITFAGIARETSTVRLGTLVTAATFRLPGPLAIAVAQVDEMSGRKSRARHRNRMVRRRALGLRHRISLTRGALRSPGRATRGHHWVMDDAVGSGTRTRGRSIPSLTVRVCPSQCNSPTRRSSSGAGARRVPPNSLHDSPPSSTEPSTASMRHVVSSNASAPRARTPAESSVDRPLRRAGPVRGRERRGDPRRAQRIGRDVGGTASEGSRGDGRRSDRQDPHLWRRRRHADVPTGP